MENKRESGISKGSSSDTKAPPCPTLTSEVDGAEGCCPGHSIVGETIFSFLEPPNAREFLPEVHLLAHQWAQRHIEVGLKTLQHKKYQKTEGEKPPPTMKNDQRDMPRGKPVSKPKEELIVILREQWNAMPSKIELLTRRYPFSLIVLNTIYMKGDLFFDECVTQMKHIQASNMMVCDDIESHFVVGRDGLVYEGRGWDAEGKFCRVLRIDFVGINIEELPTPKELAACKRLIQKGLQLRKIYVHHHVTTSRFHRLYEEVMKWENFIPSF